MKKNILFSLLLVTTAFNLQCTEIRDDSDFEDNEPASLLVGIRKDLQAQLSRVAYSPLRDTLAAPLFGQAREQALLNLASRLTSLNAINFNCDRTIDTTPINDQHLRTSFDRIRTRAVDSIRELQLRYNDIRDRNGNNLIEAPMSRLVL